MKTYAEHYDYCKKIYTEDQGAFILKNDVYDLGINVLRPNESNKFIDFPLNYLSVVESLGEKVAHNAKQAAGRNGGKDTVPFAIKVDRIWDLPELTQLANQFIPQLEKTLFGSYAFISAVHIYRNVQTKAERSSSWLWHYDNNPKEAIKLMIYLTDVYENTAPFEYLKHKDTGEVIKMETSRTGHDHWEPPPPEYPGSRIPAQKMDELVAQGYKKVKIIGQKGTLILFDNNCIHTANIPTEEFRDVVIFNIRPVHFKIRPCITEKYTGSWMHKDPVHDPELIEPIIG